MRRNPGAAIADCQDVEDRGSAERIVGAALAMNRMVMNRLEHQPQRGETNYLRRSASAISVSVLPDQRVRACSTVQSERLSIRST
jgi:hypothetical protein